MGDTAFLGNTDGLLTRINSIRPAFQTTKVDGVATENSTPWTVPSAHGRHLETANVLWMDGHVKAMKISYKEMDQSAVVSKELLRQHNVGDILKGARTGIPAEDNYYFRLTK